MTRNESAATDRPALLTPREVAASAKVCPQTVRRWIARGDVEAVRLPGGHLRLNARSVERLLGRPVR